MKQQLVITHRIPDWDNIEEGSRLKLESLTTSPFRTTKKKEENRFVRTFFLLTTTCLFGHDAS